MAVLESDLRALSAEARRRYPAVKDGAEHAILKVTLQSEVSSIFELHLVLAKIWISAALRFHFLKSEVSAVFC